jgi:hypothetical protein
MCNALITILIALCLAAACLFPASAPTFLLQIFFEHNLDIVVPYLIFILIAISLVSILFYHGIYRKRKP